MDTMQAFVRATSAQAAGAKQMIFDWNKAAQLIKERSPRIASAGLQSDWEYTGGTIYTDEDGPLTREDSYTYLSSNWATPELDLDGDIIPCFITSDNNPENWDSSTMWPASALEILK